MLSLWTSVQFCPLVKSSIVNNYINRISIALMALARVLLTELIIKQRRVQQDQTVRMHRLISLYTLRKIYPWSQTANYELMVVKDAIFHTSCRVISLSFREFVSN